MAKKRRALILYATMTHNTEKIANWFREAFEFYNWDVSIFKLAITNDWNSIQDKVYFDDYDVVCLGSPIVAGSPLQIIVRLFSLGGGSGMDQTATMPQPGGAPPPGGPPAGGPPPGGRKINQSADAAAQGSPWPLLWRRRNIPYQGMMAKGNSRPLGIVFCTYGGGFFGSDEALPSLETLKFYLKMNDIDVIGTFACCGRESGPAGLKPGEIPVCTDPEISGEERAETFRDPEVYADIGGGEHIGSFFFHTHMEQKPNYRDEGKAKALISDIVEDYFFSHDDKLKRVGSQYITIS